MLELPPGTLESFALVLARTSALVIGAPLLGSGTGFAGYKIGLIVSVALLLYGASGVPLDHQPSGVEFACLALREILIGLALSFSLHAVLVALRVAGELVGHEMGFNMAHLVDPVTGVSTPIISQIYEVFFYLGLLLVDGHHLLLRGLAESLERAPVGRMEIGSALPWIGLRLFEQMFAAGLTLAAPVLVLLLTMSLLMGLLSRAIPQFNVSDIGFTARVAMGLVALFLFAPLLAPTLDGLYRSLAEGVDVTLDAIEG